MQPRSPLSPGASSPRSHRLSVIAEDGSTVPPIPPRALGHRGSDGSFTLPIQNPAHYTNTGVQTSNRPQSRRWTDKPPHHSAEASPPGYQHWDETTPRSKRSILLEKVRGNKQIARRGGWKRLMIILAVLLAVIIALGVGLGVGLRNKNSSQSNNSSNGSNGSGNNSTAVFPEGSFAIPIYSAIVNTSCTSISSTWLCYPYSTYNPSNPSLSLAEYNWIISAADTSSSSSSSSTPSYNISTSSNPFADMFSNIPLTLQSPGTADEHYYFELSLRKTVVPTTSIAPNGQTTNCYYNNTIFRGELYTRKPSMNITASTSPATNAQGQQSTMSGSNLASSGTGAGAGNGWQPWPFAVNVTQAISGGPDVPECYVLNADGSDGARVTQGLTAQSSSTSCVCGYRNFGF